MTVNPFTPSVIASQPEDFFGRGLELRTIDRAIQQGSIAIQGPVGIGKSSLMSRSLLDLEGLENGQQQKVVIIVGHSEIATVDEAARLVLEELGDIDETKKTFKIGLPKIASYESADAYSIFKEGRYLSSLLKIIEDAAFKQFAQNAGKFIIAVDEVDKCPRPFAMLLRQVTTKTQLSGINNIRFVFAGISPYLDMMVREDSGVLRFVYKTINLGTLSADDAEALVETKFRQFVASCEESDLALDIDPDVPVRIATLSGGHPHLMQLLGSHVVESEFTDPDGHIGLEDLILSLRNICYEDRSTVYEAMMHRLELEGRVDAFKAFIMAAGGRFPGVVSRDAARKQISDEDLNWLHVNNYISIGSKETYNVIDELFRVRIIMDAEDSSETIKQIESQLIDDGEIVDADLGFLDRNRFFEDLDE